MWSFCMYLFFVSGFWKIPDWALVDKHATDLTAILFHNLKQMTGKYVVYGQHNYEMDGFDSDTSRWRDEQNRCDAYDVTGAYPAMASF